VSVGLDKARFDADYDDVRARLDELDGREVTVRVGMDKAGFDADADDATATLDELEKPREATLGMDKADFDAEADDASARMDDLEAPRDATLGMDKADFDAEADDAEARLDELEAPRTATLSLSVLGGEGAAGGSEGGGLLGALGLGIGSLLPGLGGAAAGFGLLGATGLAAFGGIGKALEAHSQASQNVGITSAQTAATSFSNAVAIQQAQVAVGEAYRQAAENATMSAEQQESAESQLAQTVRNAAASQAEALQGVTQAQQQQEQATFALSQAQYNLQNAYIQARYQLEQLRDAEDDSKASIQAATVALQQAQYQQQLTDENAMSTSLDRAQAAVAVTQAQEQLTQAQQNAAYTQQEYNLQEKAGVDGSQQVVEAKQAEQEALYGVRDAAAQMADAERNLADTEKDNAAQIRQAMLAVREAGQQAAYQQQQDALAIQQAEQNVSNTIEEQRLQYAATMSTSNEAANQFAKDMSRLSAPAQALVRQLLSMHGAWQAIESIAQRTIAPGITVFLKGIQGVLPEINMGVGLMGRAMGAAFGQFGKLMSTSAFKDGLAGLLRNGVQFANIVLPAFAQFLQMLGQVGGSKGAVTGLANLLAGIGHGLTGLAAGLRPYIGQIDLFLTAAGRVIAAIGPPLAQIIGLVAKALAPLSRYLNEHPNGTIVKMLGYIVAGLLTLKGLQKIIPDFLLKPIMDFAGKVPDLLGGAWEAAGKGFTKVFGDGGLVEQGVTWVSGLPGKISGAFSAAWSGISGFGSKMWSMTTNAGSAVVSFVSNMAGQLAQAAVATGTWIAEHTAATATFIAENVAQAASATAAFIAENAATLGIGAAIAALIALVVAAATHWHEVWTGIKDITLDVWHNYLDPAIHGIAGGFEWLYDTGIRPVVDGIRDQFTALEVAAMWLWHHVFDPVWQGILAGVHAFESAFSSAWDRIESIFKGPVNFLIGTVYDDGIRRFWNDIVGHIGLGSLSLPEIPKLARGGIVPGRDTGRDNQIVAMRSGEGVLTPEAVQAIGPGTVHYLNDTYSRGGSSGGGAGREVRRLGLREIRKHTIERPGEHLLGFSSGGILGDIGGFFTGIGRGLIDSAEFMADLATNPVAAVTSLLDKVIHTTAAGDLGKIMTAIPKTLISALASLAGSGGGGKLPGGSSGVIGSLPQNWKTIAGFLASHGFTKFAAAGVTGNIDAESGGNPEILQVGGGGGGGLIQWTPYPPGYITGNAQADLMTQLNAILSWGGGPGMVNRAISPSNAALIYQDYYERPANLTASLPQRMASANAVYRAMGWGSFDQGGWLMPGTLPVNRTGQPEAVLTPDESAAFVAWVRLQLSGHSGGAAAGNAPVAIFNYNGTQYPGVEQRALMRRDLALALSGGSQ
jgi:Phage tail lysozyme